MKCPNCGFDAPVQIGPCPRCHAIRIHPTVGESWERRNFAWVVPVAVLSVFVGMGICWGVYRIYTIRHNFRTHQARTQMDYRRHPAPGHMPVEHGGVVKPEELRGHGKLYFVPVGRQAFPAQMLADYYKQKFGAQVTVLAAVPTRPADCIPARKQCIGEELESEMLIAYPEIARDPTSVMIALTDEDIFSRSIGREYSYGFHWERIAIVSSARVDPAFWGDHPNDSIKLASTKQLLTKYVALLYFHVPESYDPTSVMFTPLTPDAGSDDLHESDLHPEDSENGRRGKACSLYFSYSYQTHKIKPDEPVMSSCEYSNPVGSTNEESFEINIGYGSFSQRAMDLTLNSTPGIQFRRSYGSGYFTLTPLALGLNTTHSLNPWITSDGFQSQSYMQLNHEDGRPDYLARITPGRGFIPGYTFENRRGYMYGARLTWEGDHYKLAYRDGAWSTFLPCVVANSHCYWTGYHDANGHALIFDRDAKEELHRVTTSDQQGISFQSDDQHRVIEAKATNGQHVSYSYDAAGCLATVHRADGQITLYKYDLAHQMTSVAVMRRAGARPEPVITNEYDAQGHVAKTTLAGAGTYKIEYLASEDNQPSEWRITTPAGETWHVEEGDGGYIVHSNHVRFPAVGQH